MLHQAKADRRLKVPNVEIRSGSDDTSVAFVDVNIIDSTGSAPYRGDVLVKGKRIVSVGSKLAPETLQGASVIEGRGRTLMSGLCDAHAHATFINSPTLDEITALSLGEHTILSARSARQFLDSGYTMCGALFLLFNLLRLLTICPQWVPLQLGRIWILLFVTLYKPVTFLAPVILQMVRRCVCDCNLVGW